MRESGGITLRQARTGEERCLLELPESANTHTQHVVFSKDSRYVFSLLPENGGLCIWEVATGSITRRVQAGA